MLSQVIAAIPSPSSNQLDIGPISLNYYGLCIGIGVVVAVLMGQKRWADRGGNPDDIGYIATWAVPGGLIGARAYHVITDWRPIDVWLKVWEGGLGIPGGLVLGTLAGYWAARRKGLDVGNVIDAIVPGIPVAQAIGRLGNWFNQEIFGGPTDLPWAVEIDEQFRPAQYANEPTFHPAFLYEAIWNLGLAGFLIWIDRRGVLKKGMILPVYIAGYSIGRFVVEGVRIDFANEILGIRINHWVSGGAILIAVLALIYLSRRAAPSFFADKSPADLNDGTSVGGDSADDEHSEDDNSEDDDSEDKVSGGADSSDVDDGADDGDDEDGVSDAEEAESVN